jgi:hypothetical protein
MTDIVTGLMGMVIMTTFVFLILVKVSDPALWVVSIGTLILMVIAYWQDAVMTHARRERADEPPPPTV